MWLSKNSDPHLQSLDHFTAENQKLPVLSTGQQSITRSSEDSSLINVKCL